MSGKITGFNTQIVQRINNRLDQFDKSNNAYQACQKKLEELEAKNVELVDLPAREALYQTLLDEYKKAAETRKADAEIVRDTTDQKHIHKYFRLRRVGKINRWLNAGQKDRRYVNLGCQEYLEAIHEATKKIIEVDIDAQVARAKSESQRRQIWAYSEIEFSLIDQTFPSCRDRLIQENPDEYLRQAALYQDKLLETNNESEVLAFGNSWIKNIPKEATWQQVEDMSFIMLRTAKKNENVDLTEYRTAVQQWLKEHPLTDNPDSVDSTPDQASSWGRRTYTLGLLYHHNENADPSPEAFQIYQSCSALYPDQHHWKVVQALYHISHRQWVEAKQSLAGLPKDDLSVSNTQTELDYFLGERIFSAVTDVFLIALSKFIPSSYREKATFDIAQTGLQLFTSGPVRRMWVPRVLGIPERATSFKLFFQLPISTIASLIAPLAGDVFDCAFRNIAFLRPYQRHESFVSCTSRTVNTISILSEPLQRSIPSMLNLGANLGSQFISVTQSYDAYREIRRSATWQAFSSTSQLTASDLTTTITIASYGDLLPLVPLIGSRLSQIASSIGLTSLATWIFSDPSAETEGSFRDKWLIAAAGIGSFAAFRFYCDYPYLWAASVMRDVDFYSSQGDQKRVEEVLAEAEKSYFVSSVKPAVRDYAIYANWLKDYPRFLVDPVKRQEFLNAIKFCLKHLKASSHYSGIRNNVLLKKLETAIRQQDTRRLEEVFKENPDNKLVILGFHFFLNHTFYIAIGDPAEACNLLKEMGPSFPSRFHPTTDSFIELLQEHSESLQEWPHLNVLTAQQNRPNKDQIDRWNNALPKLQVFFSKYVGETRVYQDLQYYKLMIAFAQTDKTQEIENLFKKADAELHQRFFHNLAHCTRQLRKEGKHQVAISLLKRAQIKLFKYNKLIQNYGDFFSLLFSSPLQRDAALKEMQKLESCIAGLSTKDECHQELRVFFESCRIVLSLDAGEYTNAQKLLAQETTVSKVPDEVAALLFERVQASLQANRAKKGLSDLKGIIENLGSWQHLELFKAYQAYLVCEPSFEAQLEHVTALITRMTPIEQLSDFASNLQYLQEFEVRLFEADFHAAKNLLDAPMPRKLHSQLCNILFMYFIHRREQQRQTVPLREVTKTLQSLNTLFALPNSDMIQSYVNFLVLLDNIEGKKDIPAHQKVRLSLKTVFEKLNSIGCPHPESLKGEMVDILLGIARLAGETGRRKFGLEALESIKEVVIPNEQLEYFIGNLQRQLNA